MYLLGTWFVSGMCVWIPCIKETIMMMMMIIIIMREHNYQVSRMSAAHFKDVL